jgi:integral membrane sensor domain MASE1
MLHLCHFILMIDVLLTYHDYPILCVILVIICLIAYRFDIKM